MGKKTSEKLAKEIIGTSMYRNNGKVVVIDSHGNRTVYTDVTSVEGKFFGGLKLTTNSGIVEFEYNYSYEVNGISCKD